MCPTGLGGGGLLVLVAVNDNYMFSRCDDII